MKRALAVSFISLITIAMSPRLIAQDWTPPENVSSNVGVIDQRPSLKIGPAPSLSGEAAHIAYSRFDTKEIVYALKEFDRQKPGQPPPWNRFPVTNRQAANAPNTKNWDPSIAVHSTGRVYIAYRGVGTDSDIYLANNVNGSFSFTPFHNTRNATDDWDPALILYNDMPYLFYAGQGGTSLATDNEIWYHNDPLPAQVSVNSWHDRDPSVAVDAGGHLHVAFSGIGGPAPAGDQEIWYAENTTGVWNLTQVTNNARDDINPSLGLDAAGNVHIAWQALMSDSGWDIFYTNNASASFTITQLPSQQPYHQYPSLVIDPLGIAHIAYQWDVDSFADIYYTHNKDGAFSLPILASTGVSTNNMFPSLDTDAKGQLHLAYQGFDGQDTEIYYTKTNFYPTNTEATEVIPERFALHGNHPNPFNPSTTIQFDLPAVSQVKLVIYDVLGRQVRVLLDGVRQAGMHEVVFDASSLPSGVYVYRIEAGTYAETRTMLLMK